MVGSGQCALLIFIACSAVLAKYATSPFHNWRTDMACDTMSALYQPWSGYRVVRSIALAWPPQQVLRLLYCRHGLEIASARMLLPSGQDSGQHGGHRNWTWPFCFTDHDKRSDDLRIKEAPFMGTACYKVIFRSLSKDKMRIERVSSPGVVIGGLFLCEDSWECKRVAPLSPLIVDEMRAVWLETTDMGKRTYNIPLLFTPDKLSLHYPKDSLWANKDDFRDINGG